MSLQQGLWKNTAACCLPHRPTTLRSLASLIPMMKPDTSAFINHLHIKNLQEALELAERLANTPTERFKSGFAVIVAFDGSEATVRFHKLRPGQTWLSDNLEDYEEGVAVLASN